MKLYQQNQYLKRNVSDISAFAYKQFSKLGTQSFPTEERSFIEPAGNEYIIRGKRITAHSLFSGSPEDAIKEDGVFLR